MLLTLIYGPLFYAIKYRITFSRFYLHLILPLVFTTIFFLKFYGFVSSYNWFFIFDDSFYYLVSSISLFIYFFIIYQKSSGTQFESSYLKKEFLHLIQFTYSLVCLFTILLFLERSNIVFKLGFSTVFLINLLIGVSFFIWFYYSMQSRKEATSSIRTIETMKQSSILLDDYEKELRHYFEESKLFLRTDISLDLLSEKTGIPKHHLSRLFNLKMGKNFYQVISEYRIKYAEERIKEDSNLTIESLAYECGFNSKSSFNKYFKKYTNYSPSMYKLSFLNYS